MKKYELVAAVSKKTGLTQNQVNEVINETCETIVETCVENGEEVNLPAFGKFRQKSNPAREGINPLTKEKIKIKETHTIKFSPTASIKKTID